MSSEVNPRLLVLALVCGFVRILGGLVVSWMITFFSSCSIRLLREHAAGESLPSLSHLQRGGLGVFYRLFVDLPSSIAPLSLNFVVFCTGLLSSLTFLGAALFLSPQISVVFLSAGILSQLSLYGIRRAAGRSSAKFVAIRQSFVLDTEMLSQSLPLLLGLGRSDFVRRSLCDISEVEISGYRRQEFFAQLSSHVYIGLASSYLVLGLYIQSLIFPGVIFDTASATASFLFVRALSYFGQAQHCWIWLARVSSIDTEMQTASKELQQRQVSPDGNKRQTVELSCEVKTRSIEGSRGITRRFYLDLKALQNADESYFEFRSAGEQMLEIPGSSLVGVRGYSGAGKSTLLETLACNLEILGAFPKSENPNRLAVSLVPQGSVPLSAKARRFSDYLTERSEGELNVREEFGCDDVLSRLGVEGALSTDGPFPLSSGGLSGGQEKRLSTIWSLKGAADIHLLDEPTSGLDSTSASEVLDLLSNIPGDRVVIASSHDQALLGQCNIIIHLQPTT